MATVMLHTRVDAETKKAAQAVCKELGINMSEAIRMFLHQMVNKKELPIDTKVPNRETKKVLDAFLRGDRKGSKVFNSVDELFRDLNG